MTNPEDLYRDPTWLRYQYREVGLTVPEMAEKAGASRVVVRKWMDRYDIETTGRGYTPDNTDYRDEDWLSFMYHEREYTMEEIADVCDVSPSTIHRWMGKFDIQSRDDGAHMRDFNPMKDPEVVANHPVAGVSGEEHPFYKGEPHGWRSRNPWLRTRRFVIQRDDEECVLCGLTREEHRERYGQDLDVHHIHPTSEGGPKYEPSNLMTLCRACHSDAHSQPNSTDAETTAEWPTPETATYT